MIKNQDNFDILFISFHTPEPRYVNASARLEESLKLFKLPYEIREMPSYGCWNLNCVTKPKFILAMMEAYPEQDRMIWIDADAQVIQYPEYLKHVKADMAAVIIDKGHGLFASLILIRNNQKVRDFIKGWVRFCEQDPYKHFTGDQKYLDNMVRNNKTITFEELPWEYSYCTGIMTMDKAPVILQHQASIEGRGEFKDCPHCRNNLYGSVTI